MKTLTIRLDDSVYSKLESKKGSMSISSYISLLIDKCTIVVQVDGESPIATVIQTPVTNTIGATPESSKPIKTVTTSSSAMGNLPTNTKAEYDPYAPILPVKRPDIDAVDKLARELGMTRGSTINR